MKDTSFGRIVGVLVSPTKTFRAIAERPTWLVAMLTLVALSSVSAYVVASKTDWQATISTKIERADREVTPERVEIVLGFLENYGTGFVVGTVLLLPWVITPLLALIFLAVFKAMGSELSFRASLGVLVHASMPGAVAALLGLPMITLQDASIDLYDPGFVTTKLSTFAGPDTSLELWILLDSVGLFSMWTLALLVIGYSVAAKVTKLRAATWLIGLWVVWLVFLIGAAALD